MDGLMEASHSESTGNLFPSPLVVDNEPNRHETLFGSQLLKRPTSSESEEHDWRLLKMTKTGSFLTSKSTAAPPSLLRYNSHSLFPDGQQMLSFSQSQPPPSTSSSAKQEALMLCNDGALSYYRLPCSSALPTSPSAVGYLRNSGASHGNLNLNLHGTMAGAKSYFTPSQWLELEHQAMIYKCLDANVPIPPSLLISIRKSLYPSGYTAYSAGSLRPGTYSWGSFQLGFSGNADPEPGRCRRTDGKKWRCTRDAVADQKYCERHLNRGRHRSRKPVEGQTGHAKAMSVIARSPASLAVSGSGSFNCSSASRKHPKNFQPASIDPAPMQCNGVSKNNDDMDDFQNLSFATTVNPELGNVHYSVMKQHNPFDKTGIALNCTSSLLDSSSSSYMDGGNFSPSDNLKDRSHLLNSFMEEWPNNMSDRVAVAWSKTDENPSECTQLSISTPIPSNFLSSSSPTHDKTNYSVKLSSHEFDPIHMGLGVGVAANDVSSQMQTNIVPVSWEASMGGPLGEVLNNTRNTLKDTIKNTPLLDLTTTGWDSSPPESSPTGVLQKTNFSSLSSSAGSSPRIENLRSHGSTGGLHDHLLASALFNPATVTSL